MNREARRAQIRKLVARQRECSVEQLAQALGVSGMTVRRDLQALWMRTKPTVVFVTHSIEEAVQLSSKVCLITPRPGLVDHVLHIDLPWPRDLNVKRGERFNRYVGDIQEVFHGYGVL